MIDEEAETVNVPTGKNGEEEMTVVVPPPKGSKLSGEPGKDPEGDTAMGNVDKAEDGAQAVEEMDPKVKAVIG